MIFQVAALSLFYVFMESESLHVTQCVLLLVGFLMYVAAICFMHYTGEKKDAEKEHEAAEQAEGTQIITNAAGSTTVTQRSLNANALNGKFLNMDRPFSILKDQMSIFFNSPLIFIGDKEANTGEDVEDAQLLRADAEKKL